MFCIGFHKTGTTSLARALEKLGYRVTGPNGVDDPEIEKNVLSMARGLVKQYDAFQDNPWPILYREMDIENPGSRFILTVREAEAWIRSAVQHFGRDETPMRKWIYGAGAPSGNETLYLERYTGHNRDVLAYFEGRPDDLLVMDLTAGDGWEKLCGFLGFEIPAIPFPHANRAGRLSGQVSMRKRFLNRLMRRAEATEIPKKR